jgi:hypothetical protein
MHTPIHDGGHTRQASACYRLSRLARLFQCVHRRTWVRRQPPFVLGLPLVPTVTALLLVSTCRLTRTRTRRGKQQPCAHVDCFVTVLPRLAVGGRIGMTTSSSSDTAVNMHRSECGASVCRALPVLPK